MHVSQLITILKTIRQEHGNIPVLGTWETVVRPIDEITVVKTHEKTGREIKTENICLLSVDEYALPIYQILKQFYPLPSKEGK